MFCAKYLKKLTVGFDDI